MAVKKDVRMVRSKKNKDKMVKKITYKCEGSYVDLNGISHRYHKRGFASNAEASEWERSFLLKSKNEVETSLTFDDLYLIFMDSKKQTMKNMSIYEIDKLYHKHIKPFFGCLKLSKINIKTIDSFKEHIISAKKSDGSLYANRTLEKIQTRLKTILKFGYAKGYIKDYRIAIFDNIQRSNEFKKEMLFWHPEEYNKFIKVVNDPIYVAFFSILYWCGLRNGETLALTWNDIDFNKASLVVNKTYTKHGRQITTPKTNNSYRTVVMPNQCILPLKALYDIQKNIIGFNTDKLLFYFDKPLDDNSIRMKKDKWIKEAGVKRIRIHDFRHSHVSLLISLGFSPFDISKRMGHTVEMVNNVYGHWFDDAQIKMVEKLNTL
ncbi:site-specific integrase [Eubacterium sp. AM47-9]|nr:site-specific integrase [Eubacterium sp. AM47-9]